MRRGKSRKGGNLFGFFAGSGAGTRQERRFAACGRGRRAAQEPGSEPFRAGGGALSPGRLAGAKIRNGRARSGFLYGRAKKPRRAATVPAGGLPARRAGFTECTGGVACGARRSAAHGGGLRRHDRRAAGTRRLCPPLQIKTGRAAFLQPGAFSVSVIFSSPFFRVLFFGAAPSAPAPLPAAASKTGRCRSGGRLRPAPACR